MRLFLRYLVSLSALLAITSILIPWHYGIGYPNEVGPRLDNHIHMQYQQFIVDSDANVVMVGDSILLTSVDQKQLSQLTGQTAINLGVAGSASAGWYLMLKNIIAKAPNHPANVVIFFRDTILTVPDYRVNGKYFTLVDELARSDDTLVIQKAFVNQMNPLEKLADAYLPVYGSRLNLRESIDTYIRYTVPAWFGCDQACNDQASLDVFKDLNLDANMLVEAIATAESYLYTPDRLNFAAQVDNSFLPDMLQIAKDNHIQLVLVRTKHLDDPSEASESPALKAYITDLKAYAQQNGVTVLDYAHDSRLTPDLFADTHHLTPQGAAVFTRLLAQDLIPILKK